MSSTHDARRVRRPMSASACVSISLKACVAISLAATAAVFVVGFPLGTSDNATAAASPSAIATPEPAPIPAVAAASVGTPCEHNGWPYVDWRCTGAPVGERVHNVRVIRLDRVAPATIVTPVASIDPALARSAEASGADSRNRKATAASSPAAGTIAARGRDHGRIRVTAQTVPVRSHAPLKRAARLEVMPSRMHSRQPSLPSASRGQDLDALAYGEMPHRANSLFDLSFAR